ncbi:hypothetical protein [Bradyrhizobium tunisiense]|uniref:hypothetical protein n=1 Tax=Bradyrhizobium tunisiense TaxID=3278709 RepID=UPI0035E2BD32
MISATRGNITPHCLLECLFSGRPLYLTTWRLDERTTGYHQHADPRPDVWAQESFEPVKQYAYARPVRTAGTPVELTRENATNARARRVAPEVRLVWKSGGAPAMNPDVSRPANHDAICGWISDCKPLISNDRILAQLEKFSCKINGRIVS